MDVLANQSSIGGWYAPAAVAVLLATAVSCASLLLLHVLSPEFSPSWRMVSEYANGHYPWLLTLVFVGWAVGSFALMVALLPLWASTLGKIGLLFLVLAGIGQTMGALFDINHKLHGPAAMIGIPSLCIAAVILTMALSRRADIAAPPLWSAHLPWISFVLMLGAFALFFSALKNAGIDMSGQTSPLSELPSGVTGYVGWANRLLFVATYVWVVLAALAVLNVGRSGH
ncbi:DUF998 domain-containing protein [Tabrizicola sp.]|uniref:DUF998 domain-containing protein n=1 Tax=Tabrizicola sp. TaxID=2005166 RepID=UPI003F3B0BF9